MVRRCDFLSVVMCEDRGNAWMHPGVAAVFESREKADAYITKQNSGQTHHRYYIDTSFLNELEE